MKIDVFFIDFDSSFVTIESLDYAVKLAVDEAVKENPSNKDILDIPKQIEEITNLGMEGKIKFKESLERRITAVKGILKEKHFIETSETALKHVSETIPELIKRIKELNKEVYILTNGFTLMAKKVADYYNINGIFANKHYIDDNGFIIGYDKDFPLAGNGGKVKIVKEFLTNSNKKAIMIGDGNNDYEVYKEGASQYFLNFALNKDRKLESKKDKSDNNFIICKNKNDMLNFINNIE